MAVIKRSDIHHLLKKMKRCIVLFLFFKKKVIFIFGGHGEMRGARRSGAMTDLLVLLVTPSVLPTSREGLQLASR